ncbi:hypothetical protein ACP4OV_012403 [Aristida adscensionis]
MAGSDENTVELGMTINDERRLCGLAGDDDDGDMVEDREALFGRSADEPIAVDADGAADGDPSGPASAVPEGSSAKRSRPSTSPVWDDFEKLFKVINGKSVSLC